VFDSKVLYQIYKPQNVKNEVKKLSWLIILKSQIAFVSPALLLISTGVNFGGLKGTNPPLPPKKIYFFTHENLFGY